jgi:hypothetical protein
MNIATVPVVVHIVLPNPFLVTDADIQAQIDRLNLDFSGLNPDSTNAEQFYGVRGHSQIQFCLAKRTPSGQLTSGIERRASSTGSLPLQANDPIKFTDQGGLDQWDPNSYLNLWVGTDASGNDVLGYAQFPGTADVRQDGVFINYKSWGGNTCYTISQYNKGRTATHEIGHYFGLFHVWGDDDGCNGDDFRDLSDVNSSFRLPTGLYNPEGQGNTSSDVGDTPNQAGATNNCTSGIITDDCATSAPGKMYQNQMDYTPDACLTMFTKKQVERMEWVLSNCRPGLLSSLGCQLPTGGPGLDAAPLESVSPGGYELTGCAVKTYPTAILCAGTIAPKFRIVNNVLQTLNSVTAGYRLDDGTAVTQTLNVNQPLGGTTIVEFPTIAVGSGAHQIKFFTSNPNGNRDEVPSNDTLVQDFTINGAAFTPYKESFESTTFPPVSWSLINPDGATTWQRHSEGKGNAGSAYLNSFHYNANGQKDDLVTPNISFPDADSVKLTFDLASATYSDLDVPNNFGIALDTLEILATKDCGSTFTSVYKKWGKDLRTVDTAQTEEFFPSSSQWRTETVDLTAFVQQSPIQLFFRYTNNFENNTFIDNINVFTSLVPASLKEKGFLVIPTLFHNSFMVRHYQQPTTLKRISVFNSTGQLIWRKDFNGNAEKSITVDLLGKSAGLYFVRLEYNDGAKNVTQRVVKQ